MVGGRMTRVLVYGLIVAALAYAAVFFITRKSPDAPAVGAGPRSGASSPSTRAP
jgi:hypothetical protein